MTHIPPESDENLMGWFQEVWSSSICQVLKRTSGEDFNPRVLDVKPISGKDDIAGVWTCFALSAQLKGEIGFFVSEADALLLSGLLAKEAPKKNAALAEDHRAAVVQFFCRVADVASPVLTAKVRGAVEISSHDKVPPPWDAAFGFCLEVRGTKTPPLRICMISDEKLTKSARAAGTNNLLSPVGSDRDKAMAGSALENDNIGLFLDIELEATLRFGERQMLLNEILDLNSGSVVELDRRLKDPVELLVRGKVVAKGDLVVVDGNYALRVTQIAAPADRMSSLVS